MKFKGKIVQGLFVALVMSLCVLVVQAQVETGIIEGRFQSKLMDREMPYRLILPVGYKENTTQTYPTIYLLHGFTGNYRNWTDKTDLLKFSKAHNFLIVSVEGANGWYTDSPIKPNSNYESYIIKELIPEIEKNYRTGGKREQRAIAGLSMGGYGGMKFGLKYPEMFVLAGSFSGALKAPQYDQGPSSVSGFLTKSIGIAFGDADSPTRKENDIFEIVEGSTNDQLKAMPYLYLDCGTEDFLLPSNRSFVELIQKKRIAHQFRELPGRHNWKYWNSQIAEFLRVADNFLK